MREVAACLAKTGLLALLIATVPIAADARVRRDSSVHLIGRSFAYTWGPDYGYYHAPFHTGCRWVDSPDTPVLGTTTFVNQGTLTPLGFWGRRSVFYGAAQPTCPVR